MPTDSRTDHKNLGYTDDFSADWLLASWAAIIEKLSHDYPDFGLGVTLTVSGATYSGVLVSGRRWAGEMATMLRVRATDPRIGHALAETFDKVHQRYDSDRSLEQPARFLHLLYAAVVDPNGERTGEGLPMRFRLDSVAAWAVAGWTIGNTSWNPPAGNGGA